jgi:hypothetical protein
MQRLAATRVLFVAGTGRSGSTIVSNLLGSVPGLVSVGELRYLWERGLGEAAVCGCGEPVPQCPFWLAVLADAYPDGPPDVDGVVAADRQLLRLRSLPRLLATRSDKHQLGAAAARYAVEVARVYAAVTAAGGGATIVDSSKLVSFGYLLRRVEGLDVRVLHLVRDPRGVAFSWQRERARDDRGDGSGSMARESPVRSAVLWDMWNLAAERLWAADPERYVRVRYEDVLDDPQRALEPVLRMVGLPDAQIPVSADGTARIGVSHTVAGNPSRMSSGPTRLTADLEWVHAMPKGQRRVVTTATAPLLGHYGYQVRPPAAEPSAQVFVEDLTGPRRLAARIRRNAGWVRSQGLARVLEEKEIDPLRTVPASVGKWRYRRTGAVPAGAAVPVFVVGVQRSGTNMLVRGLGMAPEVEVHNESDSRAFERYKLRPDPVIEAIVAASRHTHVLFKPLCDSHRTDRLLDELHTASPGRGVWVYRDVDGRVRSALAKFGDGNLQVLREFADGTNTARWHVQRISAASADLVRSFDYDELSPASGAALMWLIRNRLYFELGLDRRPDVRIVCYNDFLVEPDATMRGLCRFLDFPFTSSLVEHVTARAATYREPLDIDPVIRMHCDTLSQQLAAAVARSREVSA